MLCIAPAVGLNPSLNALPLAIPAFPACGGEVTAVRQLDGPAQGLPAAYLRHCVMLFFRQLPDASVLLSPTIGALVGKAGQDHGAWRVNNIAAVDEAASGLENIAEYAMLQLITGIVADDGRRMLVAGKVDRAHAITYCPV